MKKTSFKHSLYCALALLLAALMLFSVACHGLGEKESDTLATDSETTETEATETEGNNSSENLMDTTTESNTEGNTESDTESNTESDTQGDTGGETSSDTASETESETESDTVAPCSHEYGDGEITKSATCTEKGERTLTCVLCGESYTEEIAIIDHSYKKTGEVKATCLAEGAVSYACEMCNVPKTETLPKNNNHACQNGLEFSAYDRCAMTSKLDAFPSTFKVCFSLNKSDVEVSNYGVLLGNNDYWHHAINYRISKSGCPQIIAGYWSSNSRHYQTKTYTFNNINVATGKKVDMTIVIDLDKSTASCYINGELKQTLTNVDKFTENCVATHPMVIGGDHLGSNFAHFTGTIYELAIWNEVKSAEEIATLKNGVTLDDPSLMARFEFYSCKNESFEKDLSANGNHTKTVKLRLDAAEVEEVSDGYCFAVIGDTQSLIDFSPDSMTRLYDWLVANKEEKRIEYVIGVGDITERGTQEEFEFARDQIYKLSGEIPFQVVMGNHDKYDQKGAAYLPENFSDFLFNQTFYNETYLNELTGWRGEGDVSCSYNLFEVGETKWLIMSLDFGIPDDMIEWASEIIDQYPDYNVVIATHAYLFRDGSTLDGSECYPPEYYNEAFNNGDEVFEKLISKHSNIKLVLSGHDPWDHIVCSQVEGDNGNTVTQLLIDPQYMDRNYGPTGMVALLYFSEDAKTLTVRYYSIEDEMYGSELSQFTVSLE